MDLREAAAVAKRHVGDLLAGEAAENMRLEAFLYDDHLGVWTLTIGYSLQDTARSFKVVRVSEANQAVLSIQDR